MPLAIDVMHGRVPSNKMHTQLQPKKIKIGRITYVAVICVVWQQKALYTLYTTIKTERFSFKTGCVIQVVKHLKEDWLLVLWY